MAEHQKIYSLLRQAGMTKDGALGVMGNWEEESGCEPNRKQGDLNPGRRASREYTAQIMSGAISKMEFANGYIGYGIAQWTLASRQSEFYDYWKASGKVIDDLDMQVAFALKEFARDFSDDFAELKKTHDLYRAVYIVCLRFENPAVKNVGKRFENAKRIEAMIDVDNWQNIQDDGEVKMPEDPVQKVLDLARGEIGYRETGDNITKYAAEMDRTNWYNGPKNGFAWCDVWVDWLFYKTFGDPLGRQMICQPTGSCGAGCLYSAQYYKQAGRWHETNPQPGDQIFFTYKPGEYSHTGIVESVTDSQVVTIEGNTSESVMRKIYALGSSVIAGYGRPKWELASGASENSNTSQDDKIPRSQYWPPRLLKLGAKGKDVELLCVILQTRGWDVCYITDTYEIGLVNKVKQFQKAYGLEADGEVGPITWGKLLDYNTGK